MKKYIVFPFLCITVFLVGMQNVEQRLPDDMLRAVAHSIVNNNSAACKCIDEEKSLNRVMTELTLQRGFEINGNEIPVEHIYLLDSFHKKALFCARNNLVMKYNSDEGSVGTITAAQLAALREMPTPIRYYFPKNTHASVSLDGHGAIRDGLGWGIIGGIHGFMFAQNNVQWPKSIKVGIQVAGVGSGLALGYIIHASRIEESSQLIWE